VPPGPTGFGSQASTLEIDRHVGSSRPAGRVRCGWCGALAVGSGPFIFVKEEWRPGSQAVYVRNPDYVAGRLSE
jgi:hypothetical protein